METHATTKKSFTSRIGNLFKGKKAEIDHPHEPLTPPTQSPASNASATKPESVPEMMGTIHEMSDAEVTTRIKDAIGDAPAAKAKDDEGHIHTAACKHSRKAKPGKKSAKMRDLYPGYEGPKFTPKSPSPATLKQKLQKKARRLRRQTEK